MNLFVKIFLITFSVTPALAQSAEPKVVDGVIDLRGYDFEEPVSLDGEWLFYWEEFRTANQFSEEEAKRAIFPMIWNDFKDPEVSAIGFATYQVKVLLDQDGDYAITSQPLYTSYSLTINDQLVTKNGRVGSSKETSKPQWRLQTEGIAKDIFRETNIITLQVSNFSHFRGGPIESIIIGRKDQLVSEQNLILILDALLTGALIMGGLFFLGLYLFGRRQTSILYFSLFCLTFSYFIFGRDNYLITWIYPDIPWIIAVKLEYAVIYLMTIFLGKYIQNTYPEDSPKRLFQIGLGICGLFIVSVVLLPPSIFTRLFIVFLVTISFGVGVCVYVYYKALINNRPGSKVGFVGISIILTVLTLSGIQHLGFITLPEFVIPLGYVLFFCLQSVTTSQQVAILWEKSRLEAETALRSKSDFLSTMSHEIRTPMNAVIGLTHHLMDSHPRKDQMSALSTLKFSSENLLRLLNDILDYNKLEAGGLVLEDNLIDLKSLGSNLVGGFRAMAEDKGTSLIFRFDSKLPTLFKGDEGRLTQVLSNLIGNAIKFTEDGEITLSMEHVERDPEHIKIRFSVMDTGIGISSIDRQKIFERFNQANSSINRTYGGTGLGLAISKKILEMQGVEIHLESELGKGSEFYFVMRMRIAKGHRKKVVKPSVLEDPLKGKKILLVEDNAVNVMVAERFLQKWHCNIDIVYNGQEALDRCEDHKYDLILMDLQMPVMDGYEATKILRDRGVATPILALTATALTDLDGDVKQIGLNDFVVKPFHPDQLYEKLTQYLNSTFEVT